MARLFCSIPTISLPDFCHSPIMALVKKRIVSTTAVTVHFWLQPPFTDLASIIQISRNSGFQILQPLHPPSKKCPKGNPTGRRTMQSNEVHAGCTKRPEVQPPGAGRGSHAHPKTVPTGHPIWPRRRNFRGKTKKGKSPRRCSAPSLWWRVAYAASLDFLELPNGARDRN